MLARFILVLTIALGLSPVDAKAVEQLLPGPRATVDLAAPVGDE